MSDYIPLSVPSIGGNEWKYVKECLDTEWVSSAGKYVDLFEKRIAEYTGAKYAVACVNGTSALQVSLRLAGVQAGDEVIVPTLTFISPINAVAYNQAFPVFMDADQYYNIDAEKTIKFIREETTFRNGSTYNKVTGRKISALIVVHVFGNAVWLDHLVDLCEEQNISLVEDACESLGTFYKSGHYKGRHTGTIGKFGCLSFNGNKIITTGGGGMILTDDEHLAENAKYLTTQAKNDAIRYVHDEIGYNYRMTNIMAALGVAQLEQLPGFKKRKQDIYYTYLKNLETVAGIDISQVPAYADNNSWITCMQITGNHYPHSREEVMQRFADSGIETRPVWHPNHLQKMYLNCHNYDIENAQILIQNSLCLPCSTNMVQHEVQKVLSHLIELVE
jgi:perosamine synthetase